MTLIAAAAGVAVLSVAAVAGWVAFVNSVEQPAYSVVETEGDIEVRDYPALVVAEVTRTGGRWDAVRAGFGALARYIFAKDRGGEGISMTAPVTQEREASAGKSSEKIAMTAPVIQSPAGDGAASDKWTIRFIMPSKYGLDELPAPASGDVRLEKLPARRVAAIRFGGVATDELIAQNEARLRRWLDARGRETRGPPTYAYYNDPWTPGFLRRNEIMFEVR